MERQSFSQDDLQLVPWQFLVRHTDVFKFCESNLVFLKSNPELPLIVISINSVNNTVNVCVKNNFTASSEIISFPPECLLQYDYAGLKISQSTSIGEVVISLN